MTTRRASKYLAALAVTTLLGSGCGGSTASTGPDSRPVISAFVATPASIPAGGSATLEWTVAGATSLTLGPDVGPVSGASLSVRPSETRVYTLTATNAAGSTSAPVTVTVAATQESLEVACSGASCGAASPSRYAGSGTGVWRYRNTGAAAVELDFAIANVAPDRQVVLVMSNGSADNTGLPVLGGTDRPVAGAAMIGGDPDFDVRRDLRFQLQWNMTERNREAALRLREAVRLSPASSLAPAVTPPAAPPVIEVGTSTRKWRDTMPDDAKAVPPVVGGTYDTTARAVCSLTSGRRAIFWVDDAAWGVKVFQADIDLFRSTFCDPGKGFDKVTALRGDPWGVSEMAPAAFYIQDAPGALLDVHVVYIRPPETPANEWGGYFHSVNNSPRTLKTYERSNEALAFFINANYIQNTAERPNAREFTVSTHLHELTHLVNYFQRGVLLDNPYETWLDEVSAMMTEDLIVPAVTSPVIQVVAREYVEPYVRTGGGTSLMNWGFLSGSSYAAGGSLGAFLNRRYGTAVYVGMGACRKGTSDYACVDAIVRAQSGLTLEDEFARFGASVFALFPATAIPERYGFPQTPVTGGYVLAPIDVTAYSASRPATAKALGEKFLKTSHTYLVDAVAAGQTSYARAGVSVPKGASLMVIVR